MPKPRLAYILQDFHIGGMESFLYRIAYSLKDRYEIFFVATHAETILPKFHEVGTAHYIGENPFKLVRYLRQQKIDVVQYGNIRYYGDAALAAGVPIVIERTDGIRKGAALRSKAGLDAVIASAEGTIEPISQLIDKRKIHLIYNGIDLHQIDGVTADRLDFSEDHIVIGRVSRFGAGKNLGLLIDAVRELAPRYPHIRLVVAGGNSTLPGAPDIESELREKAKGFEEYIFFTGHVDHPIPLVKGFDIGTCVSREGNEGIPNSLLESMAAYQPVVATAVDNIPEIVRDGYTGLLIEDDNVKQLINALEKLILDADLRNTMGTAGRKLVEEQFNLEQQAKMYDELYAQLLKRPPSPVQIRLRQWRFIFKIFFEAVWNFVLPEQLALFMRRVRGKLRRIFTALNAKVS